MLDYTALNVIPIWERLQNEKRPIILYGMGNGADKILDVCEQLNIRVKGVFASDGFVRKKSFRGFQIHSYSETVAEFGRDIVVLLSFATSLPDVLENVNRIASEVTLLAPDVPAYGNMLFDQKFFKENQKSFEKVLDLLCDKRSKELYVDLIRYKLSGDISYLSRCDKEPEYMEDVLDARQFTSYIDAGAYKGDTILRQKIYSPSLKNVYAFEPDPKTYQKLCDCCKTSGIPVKAYNVGLWNEKSTTHFHGGGGRGSSLNDTGKITAELDSLDSVLLGECERVDFIKYDVEGAEYEALLGSRKIIEAHRPSMLVSLYHRSEDLFKLPLLINEIYKGSRLYLRRTVGIPAWDINLLIKPE